MVTKNSKGTTIGIICSGEETPLSTVRLCEMRIPPNGALDTSGSLHLIIGYKLKIECGDLESQVGWLK